MTEPLLAQLRELLAHRPVLLALDFDGVLAPLVDVPSTARALPGTAELLAALARVEGVQVALVSGRSLADLRLVAQVPANSALLLVGSHGAEWGDAGLAATGPTLDDDARQRLALVRSAFTTIAARHPGVHVETKPAGVVLHTRAASRADAASATAAGLAAASAVPGARVSQGKEVVEVSVVRADKGSALNRLRDALAVRAVLYAGDDVTDEDAFAVLGPGDIGIKVGPGPSRAAYRLPDPAAVQSLLRTVLGLAVPT